MSLAFNTLPDQPITAERKFYLEIEHHLNELKGWAAVLHVLAANAHALERDALAVVAQALNTATCDLEEHALSLVRESGQ